MARGADGDHDMVDEDIITSTEMNGTLPEALDPISLLPQLNAMTTSPVQNHSVLGSNGALSHSLMPKAEQDMENRHNVKPISVANPPKYAPLPYATSRTGLVYDVRMRFHVEPIPEEADMHPEDPRRIYTVYMELVEAGLVDDVNSPDACSEYVLGRIPARFATKEEICAVHTDRLYDWVMDLANDHWTETLLDEVGKNMDSVYLSRNTPMCAKLSAGGAIEAARAVLNNQVRNSIAVIRPPGHHAEHDEAQGFCFFNNVPIAAKACQREFGDACRKILIVDWDVHHGNGVQNTFYDDPNVLYISIHVHKDGNFYPSGNAGNHLACGAGAGAGKNINIPWKTAGMGDGDYMYAFQQIIMPIAQDFDPDLVMVCSGFDAAEGDMIGGCHVSPAGYAHMTHMLMSLADGKLVVCMEGGYNLRSIAVSALAVTRTLMGEQPDRLTTTQPSPVGVDTVQLVLRQQSKYWPCLYPKDPSKKLKELKGERMHDLIREWQATTLFQNHDMHSLFIARNKISKSFENQVLATPNYNEARPLLLAFHDPPELSGSPDPRTQRLELHNTFLTDGVKPYIEWACGQGFAVIDVNIPKHLTGTEDDLDHADSDAKEARSKEALTLATYLWENYIELSKATHIFILGVGAAYVSIIEMFKANERFTEHINKVFFFVAGESLHSCRSATGDDELARWYYGASLVYVAENHAIWEYSRKSKIRFGKLVQSPLDSIQEMLAHHKDDVTDEMLRLTDGWQEPQGSYSSEDELAGSNNATAANSLPQLASPVRLPPVGNFALSPGKTTQSPRGQGSPARAMR